MNAPLSSYVRRWSSAPGPDGVKKYLWAGFTVWREFVGQWWLSGDDLPDDLGPFGSSIAAKDEAVRLERTHVG